MTQRRVLGLDLATTTGWAIVEDRTGEWCPIRWGRIQTRQDKHQPEGVRFRILADALPALLEGVDAVSIERMFVGGNKRRVAEILAGYVAVALVEIERAGPDYDFVSPAKWKKWLCPGRPEGSGHVRKHEVRSALNGRGAIEPGTTISEDEADAIGVALWLAYNRMPAPEGYDLKF